MEEGKKDKPKRAYDRQLVERGAYLATRTDEVPHPGECWMCGQSGRKMSREHIFSQHLQRIFDAKRERFFPTHYDSFGNVISARQMPASSFTAGEICEPCNNEWMSKLETQFGRLLANRSLPERMDRPALKIVARWFSKTAIVLNASQNYRSLIPANRRHQCAERIPRGFRVYLAKLAQPEEGWFDFQQGATGMVSFHPVDADPHDLAERRRNELFYACGIRVADLLGYVLFDPPDHRYVPAYPLTTIWPRPPKALLLESLPKLEALAQGLIVHIPASEPFST